MNKYILNILFLLCVHSLLGQNAGRLAYKWKKPAPFDAVPPEFIHEDAYAVYIEQGIKNDYDVSKYINLRSSYYIKAKIRILTKSGLDEYSKLYIRKWSGYKTSTLDARTIKKDGKVIGITSDDIKAMRKYDDEQDYYYNEYRIAIPGVEVGDEIEYIYIQATGMVFHVQMTFTCIQTLPVLKAHLILLQEEEL